MLLVSYFCIFSTKNRVINFLGTIKHYRFVVWCFFSLQCLIFPKWIFENVSSKQKLIRYAANSCVLNIIKTTYGDPYFCTKSVMFLVSYFCIFNTKNRVINFLGTIKHYRFVVWCFFFVTVFYFPEMNFWKHVLQAYYLLITVMHPTDCTRVTMVYTRTPTRSLQYIHISTHTRRAVAWPYVKELIIYADDPSVAFQ